MVQKTLLLLLGLLLLLHAGCTTKVGVLKPVAEPDKNYGIAVFNVRNFGAKGDGVSMDTAAIQAAIDACGRSRGGEVIFPAGDYVTAPIILRSNVCLNLAAEANLLGSKNIADYKNAPSLIYAEDSRNITFTGQGTIDGQGDVFPRETADGKRARRPRLIRLLNCQNVRFSGLTIKNAGGWAVHIVSSDNIKIDGVTVYNYTHWNNDGFDIDSCQNVFISNCKLSCNDDAIALKTNTNRACKNIVITNCVLTSSRAAFRFGPESRGNFEDITVSNCVIYDTFGNGIKLQMNEGAQMKNITFSNIVMDNVTGPISMRLGLWKIGILERKSDEQFPVGKFNNILFNNIWAKVPPKPKSDTAAEGESRSCISINGVPGHYIENIMFSNIHVIFPGGGTFHEAERREIPELIDTYPEYFIFGILPSYGLYARHAKGLTLHNVKFELDSPDMRPAIVCDDVENLDISGLQAEGNKQAESLIRLQRTRQAFIYGCRPLNDIGTFLRVEGHQSSGITVAASDLHRAKTPVEFDKGAANKAVIMPSNCEKE